MLGAGEEGSMGMVPSGRVPSRLYLAHSCALEAFPMALGDESPVGTALFAVIAVALAPAFTTAAFPAEAAVPSLASSCAGP